MTLTIQELKEKIEMVEKDITHLSLEGGDLRKQNILNEYKEYLEDELKFLQNEQRIRNSTK